ncbi:Pirin-like protein 2, variant 3, partial [Lathyrus oleraceus]
QFQDSSLSIHTSMSAFNTPRLVLNKFLAKSQREGQGAIVRRGIGRAELKNFDPFLLLDHFSVSPPGGFPDHPHRGFFFLYIYIIFILFLYLFNNILICISYL